MTRTRLRDARVIPLVLGPLIGTLAVIETSIDPFFGDAALATWVSGVMLGAGILVSAWLPLVGAAIAAACYPIGVLLGAPGPGGAAMIGLIGVVGWVGYRESGRRSGVALAAGGLAFALTSVLAGDTVWELFFVPAILLPGWFLGVLARRSAHRATQLAQLAAALDAEREVNAHAAVAEERARIAREVHDAVAHSVSVMTLQLGALRRRLADRPVEQELVHGLERLGRATVEEMRGLVGILRERGTEPAPSRQPSLARVDDLVADVRAAGLPVSLEISGDPVLLPTVLDISAYRVLQEALTNVLRHAGMASTRVAIAFESDAVTVHVVNDGGLPPLHPDLGHARRAGHGLVGMRERVAVFSGTLEAGPRTDGGFSVLATFPRPRRWHDEAVLGR